MIRKVVISLTLASACILFLMANKTPSNDNEDHNLKTEWTAATNTHLEKIIQSASSIKDSLATSKYYLTDKTDWAYFEYDRKEIQFWSANEWMPDSTTFEYKEVSLKEHPSGWDLIIPIMYGHKVLTYKLTRSESGQFERKNNLKPLRNIHFDIQEKATDYPILGGKAYLNFYEKSCSKQSSGKTHLWIYALLLLGALLSFNHWKIGSVVAATLAITARIFALNGYGHIGLNRIPIFGPSIFASSELLPSLGDLLLHIVALTCLTLTIVYFLKQLHITSKRLGWLYFFLIVLIGLFGADMIRSLTSNLVLNSNISFDITNLSSIDIYTIVSAIAVASMFWIWYVLLAAGLKNISTSNRLSLGFIISGLTGLLVFYLWQNYDAQRSFWGLLPSIIFSSLSILLLLWANYKTKHRIGLYKYIVYILTFSVFYAHTLTEYQQNREKEYLNIYASKLISNKDLQAEYLFHEMENSLAQEFLQPEDFEAFSKKKERFEKRLRRLYFSGYLDKYNMLVLSFDSIGNNINSSTLYNAEDLDDIYNFQSFPTMSNHFYQVKSDRIFNGYLAKFENCDLHGHYGSVYILLEPKFIQSSYEYPQLVSKKKEGKIFDLDDYSYALYSNGLLLNQKGTFPYDLHYDSAHFTGNHNSFNRKSHAHYISHQNEAIVVLSHPNNHLKASLSTFSFSFIFFILLFAGFGLLWMAALYLQQFFLKKRGSKEQFKAFRFRRKEQFAKLGIEQVYLSTRIRISMVALVFVGLMISIYVTIQFIQINDQNRSENELMYKIREVANQLQNEVDFSKKLQDPESRQLIVNEIGDVHKIDANLYDSTGRLLASSIEDIYTQGLSAPLMNPTALQVFKDQKTSQLVHSEHIRNLSFTSAYLPLVNDKRSVIAYLNLPYYSRQNELNSEISSYTVTFVNLYLFLILLAIALAYIVSQRISKPLQIIREKMSKTGLRTNELIEWKHNDEIGRLVKQYNKMVLQLGDSAERLSESEREGAWKEMARQVAHEIKNPLTPMKLNIQHLQRAWADKNERLEDTFKRVTSVLIEQIDSLSKLATEFSSFAKMPINNFENCNLGNSLLSTITLFEKSENVDFQYNDDLPELKVFADREQLGRVFNNVIKNAIQSIPEGQRGLIRIEVQQAHETVTVVITDNGKGIKEEDQANIFVPNFSTKNSGMGLGLAITRKMLEAANGKIWFETEVNKGTSFYLQWPLVQSDI